MATQEYSISHTGSVLEQQGEDAVTLSQNSPNSETPIVAFQCPTNFDSIEWIGKRDPVRFIPRVMKSVTLADDDADGSLNEEAERTISLDNVIQPVAGETDMEDAPYQAVEAVNVTQGNEIDAADLTPNYATNEVVVAESAVAAGDEVKVYPILTEGSYKMRGLNNLGQNEGPIWKWGTPLYIWHDLRQDQRGMEVNLNGSVTWKRNETVEVMIDSPHAVVWEDADYPGAYVSSIELDCNITY